MYTNFKKELFKLFMVNSVKTFITVDTSMKDIELPAALTSERFITLELSDRAVGKYNIYDEILELTLRFHGVEETCWIPWDSIVKIESDYFIFAQTKELPIDEKSTIHISEADKIKEISVEKDAGPWIVTDTKYPHLKLLTVR